MAKAKGKVSFVRLSIPEKINFDRHVITCMTGNPHFTDPPIAMTALTTAVNTLETNSVAALSGSHEARALVRESGAIVDDLFRQTLDYVNRIANGSESIILSAGFELPRPRRPRLMAIFYVIVGIRPGEAILGCKKIPGAISYVWQYCGTGMPTKESDWVFAGSGGKCKYVITGLTPMVRYWFRVCAVTREGMQPWLDSINDIVL